jgi:hypothetical protein
MGIFAFVRVVLMLIPAGWSVINLLLLLRKRVAPAEAQAHLVAILCGGLLTAALWTVGSRHFLAALLLGAGGAACGMVWFYLIYRQSLQNTTM